MAVVLDDELTAKAFMILLLEHTLRHNFAYIILYLHLIAGSSNFMCSIHNLMTMNVYVNTVPDFKSLIPSKKTQGISYAWHHTKALLRKI